MCRWVNENCAVLCEYDGKHPKDCVMMEDGTAYQDYMMTGEDWEVLSQLVSM